MGLYILVGLYVYIKILCSTYFIDIRPRERRKDMCVKDAKKHMPDAKGGKGRPISVVSICRTIGTVQHS